MFRDLLALLACIAVVYFVVQTLHLGLRRFFWWVINVGNE
jgi:hypothetical protein